MKQISLLVDPLTTGICHGDPEIATSGHHCINMFIIETFNMHLCFKMLMP